MKITIYNAGEKEPRIELDSNDKSFETDLYGIHKYDEDQVLNMQIFFKKGIKFEDISDLSEIKHEQVKEIVVTVKF